jgi:hypothetical protein
MGNRKRQTRGVCGISHQRVLPGAPQHIRESQEHTEIFWLSPLENGFRYLQQSAAKN